MAALTRALARLRTDFNTAYPARDRTSDGWIGDAAHAASTSGHNPDDTPGSKAEYSDTDTVAEVRAIDVDADLRGPDRMLAVIERILRTPDDARRLKYVIFGGRIASKSASWVWRPYSGANPHDKHAHFSGDPAYDDDARPWAVAQMGANVAESNGWSDVHTHGDGRKVENWQALHNLAEVFRRLPEDWSDWWIVRWAKAITDKVDAHGLAIGRVSDKLDDITEALASTDNPPVAELDYDRLAEALLRAMAARTGGGQ